MRRQTGKRRTSMKRQMTLALAALIFTLTLSAFPHHAAASTTSTPPPSDSIKRAAGGWYAGQIHGGSTGWPGIFCSSVLLSRKGAPRQSQSECVRPRSAAGAALQRFNDRRVRNRLQPLVSSAGAFTPSLERRTNSMPARSCSQLLLLLTLAPELRRGHTNSSTVNSGGNQLRLCQPGDLQPARASSP